MWFMILTTSSLTLEDTLGCSSVKVFTASTKYLPNVQWLGQQNVFCRIDNFRQLGTLFNEIKLFDYHHLSWCYFPMQQCLNSIRIGPYLEFMHFRGESVGIRCILLNRTPYELEAVVMLRGSEDHRNRATWDEMAGEPSSIFGIEWYFLLWGRGHSHMTSESRNLGHIFLTVLLTSYPPAIMSYPRETQLHPRGEIRLRHQLRAANFERWDMSILWENVPRLFHTFINWQCLFIFNMFKMFIFPTFLQDPSLPLTCKTKVSWSRLCVHGSFFSWR